MRVIDAIVVHCTDSPDERDSVDAAEIRRWHTAPRLKPGEKPVKGKFYGNGWKDIGYHFVVRRNGEVEAGRPVDQVGAHAEGYNRHSLGVVWVGRNNPTESQRQSLIALVADLMRKYKIGVNRVFGHCELDSGKTCPNIDISKLRDELALRTVRR